MQWAVKTRLGALTPEERTALDAWLAADVRHRGAFIRANAMHVALEKVAACGTGTSMSKSFFRVSPYSLAAAAACVVFGAAAVVWYFNFSNSNRYVSGVGELRQVALADGTSMVLNTATKAVVRLDDNQRSVRLSEGEALFEVAKDPQRPFIVRAGDFTIEAIGTAFSVRKEDSRVDVTVTEGVVELKREGAPDTEARRLTANDRAVAAEIQPVEVQQLDRRETERHLAWRSGQLEFDGQPLSEAVTEINRHSHRRIVVEDPALADRPIVGVFRAIDTLAFAQIVAAALDAQVDEEGEIIRIRLTP